MLSHAVLVNDPTIKGEPEEMYTQRLLMTPTSECLFLLVISLPLECNLWPPGTSSILNDWLTGDAKWDTWPFGLAFCFGFQQQTGKKDHICIHWAGGLDIKQWIRKGLYFHELWNLHISVYKRLAEGTDKRSDFIPWHNLVMSRVWVWTRPRVL